MSDDKTSKSIDAEGAENGALMYADAVPSDVGLPFWKRRMIWVVIVVLLAAVAVAAGVVWDTHERDVALSGCRGHAAAFAKLKGAKDGKDVVEALGVGSAGVADAGMWDALQRADKEWGRLRGGAVPSCDASSRREARERERGAASRSDALRGARAGLVSAAKAVLDSRDAKALSDVRGSLSGKVGEYRGLLESSAGNVADEQTRTALSQRLDAAGALLGSKDARLADLQAAVQSLDGAADGVNASVRAKADADAQAAQAAAAAQAQAQAQSAPSSRQGSSSGAQPGSGRGSRVPRSSAPSSGSGGGQPSRPSAPAPSQPSQPSGNSTIDLTPSAPIPGCVNHSGFCPIG